MEAMKKSKLEKFIHLMFIHPLDNKNEGDGFLVFGVRLINLRSLFKFMNSWKSLSFKGDIL